MKAIGGGERGLPSIPVCPEATMSPFPNSSPPGGQNPGSQSLACLEERAWHNARGTDGTGSQT